MNRKVNLITLIAILLALSASVSLSAQRFGFGVSLGLLRSQFDGDKLIGFKKSGPIAGLNWYYKVNDEQQFIFDIDYINIGSTYDNEQKPELIFGTDYTLLSIDYHGASTFIGYGYKINEKDIDLYEFRVALGVRIARGFIFKTYNHNIGKEEIQFSNDNLSTGIIGPELKLGAYIGKSFLLNLVTYIGANNLISEEENLVSILRPFYIGLTGTYYIENLSGKQKGRRNKRKKSR